MGSKFPFLLGSNAWQCLLLCALLFLFYSPLQAQSPNYADQLQAVCSGQTSVDVTGIIGISGFNTARHCQAHPDPGPKPCPVLGDFNGDGVVDVSDLMILLGNYGNSGVGDINGDGVVNGNDTQLLLALWGDGSCCPKLSHGDADFNNDGVVDVSDLLALLSNWGPTGGAPYDLTCSGDVGVADMQILLELFGPVPNIGECTVRGDLNGDGIVDVSDLLILLGNYGTSAGPSEGDLNNDGVVDGKDLLILLDLFGNSSCCNTDPDLNGDGVVNVSDLLQLLASWGPAAPDSPADLTCSGVVDEDDLLVLLENWTGAPDLFTDFGFGIDFPVGGDQGVADMFGLYVGFLQALIAPDTYRNELTDSVKSPAVKRLIREEQRRRDRGAVRAAGRQARCENIMINRLHESEAIARIHCDGITVAGDRRLRAQRRRR